MFLTRDNKIKWRMLAVATLVVAVAMVVGMIWVDVPLFMFMRGADWRLWELFERVFDAKIWLIGACLVWCVFYVKKCLQTKEWPVKYIKRFNVGGMVRDFYIKTKYSYAFFIFGSVFCASVVAAVLKSLIGRSRPTLYETWGIIEFKPFSFGWMYNSMPSGHAAATFAGLVMLGLLVPRIKWATWTLAIVVGVSRIAHGAHWPTDVLFGAFIGMVAADLIKSCFSRRNQ